MNTHYLRQSLGHVLHHLRAIGIPETIAGSVTVGDGKINYGKDLFANYKYFDGIEEPLFRFQNIAYHNHRHCLTEDNKLKSNFHISLSIQNTPGLVVTGYDATQDLREFIFDTMLTNSMSAPGYKLKDESGAFFQGGYESQREDHDSLMGYIFIEFWKPEGAKAFVEYMNQNFVRDLPGSTLQ